MFSHLILPLVCLLACSAPAPKPDPQAEAWAEHYQTGRAAFDNSRFAEAQQAFSQALTLAAQFAPGDQRYSRTAHQLAQLHVLQGKLAQAESLYLHLLDLEKTLPDHHPDKVLTLDKLGDTYRLQKHPAKAEALYQRVLAFQQTHQGDGEAAATMKKLAAIYRLQQRRQAADSLAQRARAFTLRTQAYGYFVQGDYRRAEPLLQSALALQEKHFGVDHPDLSRTCYYLGRLYDAQDHYRKAEHFYRRALALEDGHDPDQIQPTLDALIARTASAAR